MQLLTKNWHILLLFALASSCTPALRRPLYFLDGELDESRYVQLSEGRKIGPGDVLYVEFFEAYAHNKGKTAQMVSRLRIPLRRLGDSSYLKEYEKGFLLEVLASGAKRQIAVELDEIAKRKELIVVWNFMMAHLKVGKLQFNRIDLHVDWRNLPDTLAIKKYLQTDDRQELIMRPRDPTSIYDYLTGVWMTGSTAGVYYQRDPSGQATPFVFVNYSVQFNGLSYSNRDHFGEEASWSLYDWLYCGVPIVDCMCEKRNKVILHKIAFKGRRGYFRIVRSPNNDATYTVRYDDNIPGTIVWRIPNLKGRRRLKEEELRYVHPAVVRKLKFK